jgi:hypothetical protein
MGRDGCNHPDPENQPDRKASSMSTIPSPAPHVKAKKQRFVRVLAYLPRCGDLLVRIEEITGRTTFQRHYYVRPISSDFGKAFAWEKFSVEGGETYHVCLDGDRATCECKGHLAHGHRTVCKHIAATRKLIEQGKL